MKKVLLISMIIFTTLNIVAQDCLENISDNKVIMLKKNNRIPNFITIKENKTSFQLLQKKNNKVDATYINSFDSKYILSWNAKKLTRNKRSIIANSILGGLFTIPVLALIPTIRNTREPIGSLFAEIILTPIAGLFNVSAIGLGIKRAMIKKKAKQNKLNCNF